MYVFTICIAGLPIKIEALYSYTKVLCEGYYSDDPPVFTIRSTEEAIMQETTMVSNRRFDPGYLESLAVYRQIADRLPDYKSVLVHGSSIAVDGGGYLFSAKSGTGKSTHTYLWMRKFGASKAIMVNDDKPVLRLDDNGIYVCGTPWNGKHRIGNNVCFPLKAICFMQRAEDNYVKPLSFIESFASIMNHTYRPDDASKLLKTTDILEQIVTRIFCCRLFFNNFKQDAADRSYEEVNRKIVELEHED